MSTPMTDDKADIQELAEERLVEALLDTPQKLVLDPVLQSEVVSLLPTTSEQKLVEVRDLVNRVELVAPVDERLYKDVVAKDLKDLTESKVLKPFPKAMTKQVYRCVEHKMVLAVAVTSQAERALRSEIETLQRYSGAGLRSALHAPLPGEEGVTMTVEVNGKKCLAAFQPFIEGVMAQLKPKEGLNASELLRKTLDDWKKAHTGKELASVEYARRLRALYEDILKIAEYYQRGDMYDLQFFIDQNTGQTTLFDPGDPEDSSPTTAQMREVGRWPAQIKADILSLLRTKKNDNDVLNVLNGI